VPTGHAVPSQLLAPHHIGDGAEHVDALVSAAATGRGASLERPISIQVDGTQDESESLKRRTNPVARWMPTEHTLNLRTLICNWP
jgi:hypothetical protein